MLSCERTMCVPRRQVRPIWTRSCPASIQPKTVGQHLRQRRFDLGIRQTIVARMLKVSKRTLSCWECDRIYPSWEFQPRIADYLGFDPFDNPALGRPKGNESNDVANLRSGHVETFGNKLMNLRLNQRKNRQQMADEIGVSVKTLRDWERNRRRPSKSHRERLFNRCGTET